MNTTNKLVKVISENDGSHNYKITIRLDDECGNGYERFSITGTFWKTNKSRSDRNLIWAGSCHDSILEVRPDLIQFVRLHLCDYLGAPLYAVENGNYQLGRLDAAKFCEYFNCTPSEYDMLKMRIAEYDFLYLLTKSEIPARWKAEALEATMVLEDMIGGGVVFKSTATRSHFEPIPADVLEDYERKRKWL